jgi:hypothetical protein
MSDKKISELAASTTPLAGTEVLPVVQSNTTKNVSVANLTAGRAVSGASFSVTGSAVPANGVYLADTNVVGISTNSAVKILVNAAGQTGIGLTPYASVGGNGDLLQIGNPLTKAGSGLVIGSTTTGDFQFSDAASGTGQYAGLIRYTHTTDTMSLWTNSVSKVTLGSTGDLTVQAGNLVIGTAGKGIDFSADPSAAGMTSELLDDYEEGTWTPTVSAPSGAFTTVTTSGTYTKIGNLVRASFSVVINNIGTATAMNFIGALPFTSSSGAPSSGAVREFANTGLAWTLTVGSSTTSINTFNYLNSQTVANGATFNGSIVYYV